MKSDQGETAERSHRALLTARAPFYWVVSITSIWWLLFLDDHAGSLPGSLAAWSVLGLALGVLFISFIIVDSCVALFWRKRLISLRLAVSACPLLVYLVSDALHFSFFREHLNYAALQTGYLAITGHEVNPDTGWFLSAVFFTALWLLVGMLVVRGIASVIQLFGASGASRQSLKSVVGAFAAVASFWVGSVQAGSSYPELPALLRLRLGGSPPMLPALPSAERFTIFTEREQFRELEAAREKLLSQPLHVEHTPNILVIHVEGLRSDMLTGERMPKLFARMQQCQNQKRCIVGVHHYSTGNNTGTGVFGILTGLYGYYYHVMRRQFATPLPLEMLRKLGYRVRFYAETDWSYDDLLPLFFTRVGTAAIQAIHPLDNSLWREESQMLTEYLDELSRPSGPRFDYLVWSSTHYNYFYPAAFEFNTPVLSAGFQIDSNHFMHLRSSASAIKNRYLNSVRYFDDQIGSFLDRLEVSGQLQRSIVVILGDHGEEFWEHGRFGHTYGLTNEQTETTFVMLSPNEVESRYQFSSHADIFPTIFDMIGLDYHGPAFMTGKSLLRYDPSRDWTLVSMGVLMFQIPYEHAIIGSNYKVQFQNDGPLAAESVTDLSDQQLNTFDPNTVRDLLSKAQAAKSLMAAPSSAIDLADAPSTPARNLP